MHKPQRPSTSQPQPHPVATSSADGSRARARLLAALPVSEQRRTLAGISTALLVGGAGTPLVLLHGPGGHAAHWLRVLPELVRHHRVIAPDLPGHGATELGPAPLNAERLLDWLEALIEQTCSEPPTVVGEIVAGAVAMRFAARHPQRLSQLVLSDTFGLCPFRPEPEFARAIQQFAADPSPKSCTTRVATCTSPFRCARACRAATGVATSSGGC